MSAKSCTIASLCALCWREGEVSLQRRRAGSFPKGLCGQSVPSATPPSGQECMSLMSLGPQVALWDTYALLCDWDCSESWGPHMSNVQIQHNVHPVSGAHFPDQFCCQKKYRMLSYTGIADNLHAPSGPVTQDSLWVSVHPQSCTKGSYAKKWPIICNFNYLNWASYISIC